MLKFCCTHPPALELLLNAYDRIPPPDTWVEAVPPELWEVRGRGAAVTQRRRHGRPPPRAHPSPPPPPPGAPRVLHVGRAHGGAAPAPAALGTLRPAAAPRRPLSLRRPRAVAAARAAPLRAAAAGGDHLLSSVCATEGRVGVTPSPPPPRRLVSRPALIPPWVHGNKGGAEAAVGVLPCGTGGRRGQRRELRWWHSGGGSGGARGGRQQRGGSATRSED